MASDELIIGKRYWLDSVKDISGIYIGYTENGGNSFNKIKVKKGTRNEYITNEGKISFGTDKGFYLV